MVRISGIDLKNKKRIEYALTDIYGIGVVSAKQVRAMYAVLGMVKMVTQNPRKIVTHNPMILTLRWLPVLSFIVIGAPKN